MTFLISIVKLEKIVVVKYKISGQNDASLSFRLFFSVVGAGAGDDDPRHGHRNGTYAQTVQGNSKWSRMRCGQSPNARLSRPQRGRGKQIGRKGKTF